MPSLHRLNKEGIGPPGSGKSTQARHLATRRGATHLSVGALLRAEVEEGTGLGRRVQDAVESGELVSTDDVIEVLRQHPHLGHVKGLLALLEAEAAGGWVLDGAPRTTEQAARLDELLHRDDLPPAVVVALELPEAEIRARLSRRAQTEGRADDTPEVVTRRLAGWAEEAPPLLEWYSSSGTLVTVPSTGDIDTVADRVARAVDDAT